MTSSFQSSVINSDIRILCVIVHPRVVYRLEISVEITYLYYNQTYVSGEFILSINQ